MAGPHHRGPDYERRAAAVRARANANPRTRCWRCGKTLAEHEPHRNGKRPRWEAGHTTDGKVGGELKPEASTCNKRAGIALTNARRRGQSTQPLTTSRRWL